VLPPLTLFGGVWPPYEEQLYEIFRRTLITSGLTFRGLRVSCRYHPPTRGKHAVFWHLISDGKDEEERIPDLRRCERLAWIAWIILNFETCAEIITWRNRRKGSEHVILLHTVERYVVVLEEREKYCLLVTAYLVKGDRRFNELMGEYGVFKKANP
jgi:hypothetical protein